MNKKKYFSILMTLIFCIVFLNVTNYNASINEQYLQETMDMNALYVDCSIYDFYQNRDDFNKLIDNEQVKQSSEHINDTRLFYDKLFVQLHNFRLFHFLSFFVKNSRNFLLFEIGTFQLAVWIEMLLRRFQLLQFYRF